MSRRPDPEAHGSSRNLETVGVGTARGAIPRKILKLVENGKILVLLENVIILTTGTQHDGAPQEHNSRSQLAC